MHSERSPLCLEAAREIERTAAMLREAKAEIIRLRDAKRRAAGETLASIAKSYAVDISMISRLAQ